MTTGYKNDKAHAPRTGQLFEHYCDAAECKAWGSFGYKTKYGQLWFCIGHREEGEIALNGTK